MYFRTAASLLRSTRDDFTVLPLVFIQAVIGLEKLLRIYFGDLATKRKLSEMLDLVVKNGVVTDAAFSNPGGLTQLSYGRFESDLESHAQGLAILIPKLRNDLLHGEYLLSHEFLSLTIQVREMVDAIVPLLTAENVLAARDAVLSNSLSIKQRVYLIKEKLSEIPANMRKRTIKSLQSWIGCQFQHQLSEAEVTAVLNGLKESQWIDISADGKVSYFTCTGCMR